MSKGTGIAGAMDHQPARAGEMHCVSCGAVIDGNIKTNPSARAVRGWGLVHSCSEACNKHVNFEHAELFVEKWKANEK